jgi:hypothetical protein
MSTDWLPGPRAEILSMCGNWLSYMTEARRTAWGVPEAEYTELGTLYSAAESILQKAMDKAERSHLITVQCREAFDVLTAKMRFVRDRRFKVPPLTPADWAALGFRERDNHNTPVSRPESQAEADLVFPGIHLVELQNIRPVAAAGDPNPRGGYGVRIYYGLSGPPTDTYRFRVNEPPAKGSDLPYSLFTRRKKERFDFDGESGNRVYFCLRYENAKGGKEGEGPFGPILTAIIP